MNPITMMRWFSACCISLCVSGCMGLLVGDPHPWAYVTRMGDADTIGKWTMEQTNGMDGKKVWDGLCALSERMGSTLDKREARKAMDWFVRIVDKVEDWPPDRVVSAGSGEASTTKGLIQGIFFKVSFDAYSHPVQEELLRRLRPSEKHVQWLGDWEKTAAKLEEQRQRSRDLAEGKPLKPQRRPVDPHDQ
jgi:hypothetical protein